VSVKSHVNTRGYRLRITYEEKKIHFDRDRFTMFVIIIHVVINNDIDFDNIISAEPNI